MWDSINVANLIAGALLGFLLRGPSDKFWKWAWPSKNDPNLVEVLRLHRQQALESPKLEGDELEELADLVQQGLHFDTVSSFTLPFRARFKSC